MKTWTVYLSGEIHNDWRGDLQAQVEAAALPVVFTSPVTDHGSSDDCGVTILGEEEKPFWKDRKGAQLNAIRTQTLLRAADIVVVRFGEKYKQWNAAFEAGYAAALGKPFIVMHDDALIHPLKEVDAAALAVVQDVPQLVSIFRYVTSGALVPPQR
ncbi:MAG: YtoQ family protein [Pseudomonadota bacterium]